MKNHVFYSHRWGSQVIRNKLNVLFIGLILSLFLFAGLSLRGVFAATSYNNGFESDTANWTDATRVASGTDGISASDGGFYAKATNSAFTQWGGYENTFPAGGYTTKVDVYLDMAKATGGGTDKRFDFSSAINQPSGAHRRDFVFSLGTNPAIAGQWAATVSNTTPGWPLNPARSPATITETGWYTLEANFHDNGSGVLAVTMSVIKTSDSSIAGTWTLSDPSDVIGTTVGGHRYGWFAGHAPDFATIAIDNASLAANVTIPACSSDDTTFDTFSGGNVNGQHGWQSTGAYDQAVVDNIYGYNSFGCKSLRLSNAVASYSFGDQTFSYSTANEAGEVDSTNGGKSGGTRQNHYEAQFDIASTKTTEQSGLAISVSPDRGDGSRMSYLRFADSPSGIDVFFSDVQGTTNPANFVDTNIGTLSRTEPHTVKFVIDYLDGPSNDIVKVYIDGNLAHTGTTWENYYRYDSESSAEQSPRTSDSLLVRAGGSSVSATSGNGFLFDNVGIATSTTPPPAAPNLVSPANNSFVNATAPIANDWSDVAGADHYVYQSYNVDGSGNCNLSSVRFTSDYTASQTNSRTIADGLTFCWRVKTVNGLGQESDWSDLWKVTIDNTAPSAPNITFPTDGQYFTGSPILNDWTNSTDAGGVDHYQIEYIYDDGHTFSGGPYRETPANQSQRDHAPATSEQGGVKIRVRAYDKAGNVSAWSNQVHYYYDATAPSTPVNGLPNGTYEPDNEFDFTWDASTDNVGPVKYEYQATQNPAQSGGVLTSGLWHSGTLSTNMIHSSGAGDGVWYWQVRAKDGAGNYSSWSTIWNMTIDSVAPGVPTHVSPADGSFKTTANQSLIDWNDVSDASGVTYKYQSSLSSATNPNGSFVSPAYTSGALSASEIPTPGTPEGTYFWHVKAVDGAGHESAWSNAWTVVIDNTAPSAPSPSLAGGDYTGTQSVSLSASDGLSGLKDIYYTTNGSTPDNSSTVYSGPISVTQDTTIKAIAYDNSGNSSSVMTAAYGIAPVISGEGSIGVTTTSITLVWDTDHPATSRVLYDTVSHSGLGSAPNYGYAFSTVEDSTKVTSHSVTISGLTPGETYYFRTVSHGSPESVSDEIVTITKVASSSSSGSNNPVFRIFTGNNSGPTSQAGTNNPGGTGQVLATATNPPAVTENIGDENSGEGSVQSAASGTSSATTEDNDKSFFKWGLILLILALLALVYDQYRRCKNKTAE